MRHPRLVVWLSGSAMAAAFASVFVTTVSPVAGTVLLAVGFLAMVYVYVTVVKWISPQPRHRRTRPRR